MLGSSGDRLRELRIPQTLLTALVALVPLTWLIIQVAGEEPAGDGGTCPAINDGIGAALLVSMIFGSAILGGVAVAASRVTQPDSLGTGAYALAAVVVPYVIGTIYFANALCWLG